MPEANLSHAGLEPAAAPTLAGTQRRCRVFVSYSHQDAAKDDRYERGLLQAFEVQLAGIRQSLLNLGLVLHEDEIFIDRQRLSSEPKWSPAIENALAQCDLLVFLLSDDSRASKYCIPVEVNAAVKRKVPVVPVILRPTNAGWIHDRLADGSTLGDQHSGGIPKMGKGNALAVTHPDWKEQDLAWQAMASDLTDIMLRTLAGRRTASIDPKILQVPALHLPFLCNQDHQSNLFANAAEAWQVQRPGQALLTILQGSFDDALDGFADRLWRQHLQVPLQALGWRRPDDLTRMSWPRGEAQGERFRGVDIVRAFFAAIHPDLHAALASCIDMRSAAALLAGHLVRQDTGAVVLTAAINGGDRNDVNDLRTVLECLQNCGEVLASSDVSSSPISKLVLILNDQRAKPPSKGFDWAAQLNHPSAAHPVRLLVLPPLGELSRKDLRDWHANHQADLRLRIALADCISLFDEKTRGLGPTWKKWRHRFASWSQRSMEDADERCPLLRAGVFASSVWSKFPQPNQQPRLNP